MIAQLGPNQRAARFQMQKLSELDIDDEEVLIVSFLLRMSMTVLPLFTSISENYVLKLAYTNLVTLLFQAI